MKKILQLFLLWVLIVLPNMVKAETLDINSKEVTDLADKYKIGSEVWWGRELNVDNMMKEEYAFLLSWINDIDYTEENLPDGIIYYVITKEDYNNAFKNTFGPDISIVSVENGEIEFHGCGTYVYNPIKDRYERTINCGLGTGPTGSYLDSASKTEDLIVINEKRYTYNDYDPTNNPYIYLNGGKIKVPVTSLDKRGISSKYGDYLDTYKYVFKKASDDKYYFYSLENLKDAKEYKNTVIKTSTKVENPKTADGNIILMSIIGIVSLFIVVKCSKKVFSK